MFNLMVRGGRWGKERQFGVRTHCWLLSPGSGIGGRTAYLSDTVSGIILSLSPPASSASASASTSAVARAAGTAGVL